MTLKRMTLIAVHALMGAALLGGPESDSPQPPADPALRAEIEGLVRDLGHSDYARREEATKRLEAIGADAVWALAPAAEGDDAEARLRAKELLSKIAWVSPAERKEIDRLVGILKTTRNPEAASKAFSQIKEMGSGARKILRGLFPDREAAPGDVELTVALEQKTVERGKPLGAKVRLKNAGKEPLWIRPDDILPMPKWEEAGPFPENGQIFRAVRAINFNLGGFLEGEPFDLLYLEPGESYETQVMLDGIETALLGRFQLAVQYDTHKRNEQAVAGIAIQLKAVAVAERAEPPEDPEKQVETRPTRASAEAQAGPVFVLPPLDAPPGDLSVDLGVDRAEAERGKPFPFRLVLKTQSPDGVPIALPQDGGPGRSFWAALLDEKGDVAAMKVYRAAAGEAPRTLKPGEAVTLRGEIPLDVPPGRYRLVAGYSGSQGDVQALAGVAFGVAAKVRGKQDPSRGWTGEAVAPAVPVTVK